MQGLILMLSAMATFSAHPPDSRQILVQTFDGEIPKIEMRQVSGSFKSVNKRITMTVKPEGLSDVALITSMDGYRTVRLKLHGNRSKIKFDRIVIMKISEAQDDITITVPYGAPQTECFINGYNVFGQIILTIDKNGAKELEEKTFKNCESVYTPLKHTMRSGAVVIESK